MSPRKVSIIPLMGPMNYDFDEWKIELRFESDVTSGGDTDGPVVSGSYHQLSDANIKNYV